jgi:hypothetical protein
VLNLPSGERTPEGSWVRLPTCLAARIYRIALNERPGSLTASRFLECALAARPARIPWLLPRLPLCPASTNTPPKPGLMPHAFALYEAALNDEDQTVRRLLSEHSDIEAFREWLSLLQTGAAEDQNLALAVGLRCAQEAAEEIVHKYCRQVITGWLEYDIRPSVSYETDISWTFDNLLGAMYLQMYWLMTSSESIARCEHCGLIISLGRPHPEGRKRRSDKRFCNDACRQAHHRSKKQASDVLS